MDSPVGRCPNQLLESIYATRSVQDSSGNSFNPFPVAISRREGLALYRLARETGARRILEIGMAHGISSLFLAQALRDNGGGEYAAIDPHERTRWKSIGLLNLERAGLADMVTLHEAPSYEALPQLLRGQERFDLAFIDGAHLFDYVMVDIFYVDKLLAPEGCIVFDDTWLRQVDRAVAWLRRSGRYKPLHRFSGPRWGRAWNLLSGYPRFLWAISKNPWWFFGGGRGSYWAAFRKIQDDFLPLSYALANRARTAS